MAKMTYSQETRDLAQLAGQRVSQAFVSVLQLCDGKDQALQVALMAAGTALGCATGAVTKKYGCTHEEAKALLLDLILKNPEAPTAPLSKEPTHDSPVANMVLVPREPTDEMLGAWYRYKSGFRFPGEEPAADTSDYGAYAVMLSVAPQPSMEGEVGEMIELLLDAQQDINLSANETMSQPLADASALIDKVENLLRALSADNARLREERDAAVEVLKPFAEASANLDDSHPDISPIWESPAAMGIDAKHLRAAQSFLDTQGGGNG